MNKNEAEKIFKESKDEAISSTEIKVTRTIKAIKMIISDTHDITFLLYNGEISKIEEFNGRELIEKYVER